MKLTYHKKIVSIVLIASLLFSPIAAITQEDAIFASDPIQLLTNLDQLKSPLGHQLEQKLYAIGEQFEIISRRAHMKSAIDGLDQLSLRRLSDESLNTQFQQLLTNIHELHNFLEQAYEHKIPQSHAALYRHLRNLTYGDRFAIPLIGLGGAATGYGTAVVRARLMHRFIELLGLTALGKLGDKIGKAMPHIVLGIFSAIILGSIYYHWRKYNKLWLEQEVDKYTGGLKKQYDKQIKRAEKEHLKTIDQITKTITTLNEKSNKRIDTLEEHDQNIRGAMMQLLATMKNNEESFINQLNPLTQALNTTWAAIIAQSHQPGGTPIPQETIQQYLIALATINRELAEYKTHQESLQRPGMIQKFKNIFSKTAKRNQLNALTLTFPTHILPQSSTSTNSNLSKKAELNIK